jgi:hypothetical protein
MVLTVPPLIADGWALRFAQPRSFPSLYQWPRTIPQDRLFVQALTEMAGLYASAGSTAVIQIKFIPPRPPQYDGVVSLRFTWDVLPGELINRLAESETLLEDALKAFEEVTRTSAEVGAPELRITKCNREHLKNHSRATVVFASHEEAERAVAALEVVVKQLEAKNSTEAELPQLTTMLSADFVTLAPLMTAKLYYNDLSYDCRGWVCMKMLGNVPTQVIYIPPYLLGVCLSNPARSQCLFESFASVESMVWLGSYPSVQKALNNLSNSKLYQVEPDGSSQVIDQTFELPPSFGSRKNALEQATFTGAAVSALHAAFCGTALSRPLSV